MPNNRKLGVYWGNTGVNLVELNKDTAVTSTFVSFSDIDRQSIVGSSALSEDLKLLDLLQKTLRSGSFSTNNAFLSLPSKDIIVRWFVIPWVKAEEIQGMVTFEAKKYIPFPLEDLYFNYYPSTITKDGARQIGVALTAIRKTHYERYINVLIQAGVNVVFSEPSAMSLLRTLVFRKHVNTDQTLAILIARETSCEIAIVSKGYVRFIRDFSLKSSQPSDEPEDDDFFRMKFFNEVRMSLDFFARNNPGPEVEKILAISSGMKSIFFDGMTDDVGLPVQVLERFQILENTGALVDISYIRAFGVALSGEVPAVVNFNLSEGVAQSGNRPAKKMPQIKVSPSLLALIGAVVLCLSLLAASFWWVNSQMQAKLTAKQDIAARLGRFLDKPKEDIDAELSLASKKVSAIKSLPLKSTITSLFLYLVKLVPDGVWFDSFDVSTEASGPAPAATSPGARARKLTANDYYVLKSSIKMIISGYASLGDTNSEFELVNQFVEKVSTDPLVKKSFTEVKLKSLQAKDTGAGIKLTAFTIEFR